MQESKITIPTHYPHIVRIEGVCGGEPLIGGLRVTVRHVATLYRNGESAAEIAESLNITVPQVFHALSYYADCREEIDAMITEEEIAHARLATESRAGDQTRDLLLHLEQFRS